MGIITVGLPYRERIFVLVVGTTWLPPINITSPAHQGNNRPTHIVIYHIAIAFRQSLGVHLFHRRRFLLRNTVLANIVQLSTGTRIVAGDTATDAMAQSHAFLASRRRVYAGRARIHRPIRQIQRPGSADLHLETPVQRAHFAGYCRQFGIATPQGLVDGIREDVLVAHVVLGVHQLPIQSVDVARVAGPLRGSAAG